MRKMLIAALLLASCVSALADSKSELTAWHMRIYTIISQNSCYPHGTQDSGVVRVLFNVGRDGRVHAAKVLESSGSSVLDESALLLVYGSEFPEPPREVSGNSFKFAVPVRYVWKPGNKNVCRSVPTS
jgi:protein TonB